MAQRLTRVATQKISCDLTLWGTRLLPGGGNFEQSTRSIASERAGEIVTLRQVAPELSQAVELLLRLYTLGDNLEA